MEVATTTALADFSGVDGYKVVGLLVTAIAVAGTIDDGGLQGEGVTCGEAHIATAAIDVGQHGCAAAVDVVAVGISGGVDRGDVGVGGALVQGVHEATKVVAFDGFGVNFFFDVVGSQDVGVVATVDVDTASTIDVGTDDGGVVASVDVDTAAVDVGCGVGQVGVGMGDGGGAATQAPPGFFLLSADRFVVAALLCGGEVRSFHVQYVNAATLKVTMEKNISKEAHINTDSAYFYRKHGAEYASHEYVNHSAHEYLRDGVTTNTVEGYFSILKRGLIGTFHHVGEQHLQRYCNEFDFRYNTRSKLGFNDTDRTNIALKGITGKRLMYQRTN